MALSALQPQLEQLDSFGIESVKDVCSTRPNWQVDDGEPVGNGQPGPFELHEFSGCIGFGGGIPVESKGVPIASYNLFRIPELQGELGVRVFAKVDACSSK